MRILVATDQWAPDVIGGSARVAADTARALGRRGHEVVVLAPRRESHATTEIRDGAEVRRVLARGPFPQTLADPVATLGAARALRGRSFDILLAHQATGAAGLLAARLDAPLALVFHASVVLEMRFFRGHLGLGERAALYALEPMLAVLESLAASRAQAILVLSEYSAELMRARHPRAAGRIRVVGGGVDQSFFDPPSDASTVRRRLGLAPGTLVFSARRLEPRMGLDLLIEAIARVPDEGVRLAIAGTGSARQALEGLIRRLGLERRVYLLGRVSEDELRALYATADLFVLPTVAYEGFGMSTVEALAAGTPVLGTAVGATPEILRDLGPEFVCRADPEALGSALERVLALLGPELRTRARRLAEQRYRWETTIPRWEEALKAVAR